MAFSGLLILVGHAGHELSEACHLLAVEESRLRFLQVE